VGADESPGARHGRYETVVIESDRVRLLVVPAYGAKVVSLLDRRSGREWLTSGSPPSGSPPSGSPPSGADARDAPFDGTVAYGWDECLPSVAAAPDPVAPDRRLRDHGDAWGRATSATTRGDALETAVEGVDWPYAFGRRLLVEGASIRVDYELVSRADRPLPFLWSMHPLLALEPGSRLRLPGVDAVIGAHAVGAEGMIEPGAQVGWPGDGLDEIRPIEAGMAVKLYAGPLEVGRAAAITPDGSWLALEWDTRIAPYVGLWLDYGGWPADDPLHQVAIEPTTAPADDLPTAVGDGLALRLVPGAIVRWWVEMTVGAPGEPLPV
jgi:galactose mutarotase-like enzyme